MCVYYKMYSTVHSSPTGKVYFYTLDQSLWCAESHCCHWLTLPGRSSSERKWERRDLRGKCQGSHFLI